MSRLFTLIATAWRFGLDGVILSASTARWARTWRRLNRPRLRSPGPERLRLALEHLGPIFVKFGQQLSTRRDLLPLDYADELAKLQDRVPPESEASMFSVLESAYGGDWRQHFSDFESVPVGSASVAQVHRARLRTDNSEVAVKVLRPGIDKQIRRDLRLLSTFAWLAERLLPDGKRLKPIKVIEEFARHLRVETNLLREAANCVQIGDNGADESRLRVPKVYWRLCRREVMVMSFLHGVPISRIDEYSPAVDKKQLARAGIRLFFTQVFRDNFFHADMHPGNLHVDSEGHFILLDYGIVGQLSSFDREYLLRNFLAFFNRDYRRVAEMHIEAGWVPPHIDIAEFEAELRTICEPIFSQPLKDISFGNFLLGMFQTARRFHLEVQPQLVLLQKTLLNVEGMGRELDPDINMWDTAKPVLEQWSSRQYGLRQMLREIRRQAPDWHYLLRESPVVLRTLLSRAKESEPPSPPSSDRFWRLLAVVSMAALLVLLFTR